MSYVVGLKSHWCLFSPMIFLLKNQTSGIRADGLRFWVENGVNALCDQPRKDTIRILPHVLLKQNPNTIRTKRKNESMIILVNT